MPEKQDHAHSVNGSRDSGPTVNAEWMSCTLTQYSILMASQVYTTMHLQNVSWPKSMGGICVHRNSNSNRMGGGGGGGGGGGNVAFRGSGFEISKGRQNIFRGGGGGGQNEILSNVKTVDAQYEYASEMIAVSEPS